MLCKEATGLKAKEEWSDKCLLKSKTQGQMMHNICVNLHCTLPSLNDNGVCEYDKSEVKISEVLIITFCCGE